MACEAAREAWAVFERQEITSGEFMARLNKIYKPDYSKEQAQKILNACSPYQVTGRDSPSDVQAFLSDFDALQGKVSTSFPAPSMENYFHITTEPGRFSTCIGSLLSGLTVGRGEEFIALKSMSFQRIWDLLQEAASEPSQLSFISTTNNSEKTFNNWNFFIKSERPDNIVMGRGKVYMFGEEKEKLEEFEKAKAELTAKIVELPPAMYGRLKFVICYAAAGHCIQFFMLRLRKLDGAPILTPVSEMLDATLDSPRLVLHYIKLYFLLLGMSASVSGELPFELYAENNLGHCQIKLTLDGAVKRIPDFENYSSQYQVCFDDLKTAYTAAKSSGGYMVSSVFGPSLEVQEVDVQREVETAITEGEFITRGTKRASASDSSRSGSSGREKRRTAKRTVTKSKELAKVTKQVYEVETLPLCAVKEPKTEEELRAMAYGVLRGLKALHDAGLVHRDIRFPNIMYDYSRDKYVLIDLESVCKDGQVPAFKFRCWNARTLDGNKRYTTLSDFHQLGLLLELSEMEAKSEACETFIHLLLSKSTGTTAESLLAHEWISQMPVQKVGNICKRKLLEDSLSSKKTKG